MNATDIWAGNDYAYVPSRGRGATFYYGATRVKAIRTLKKRDIYSERRKTCVEVEILDRDGTTKYTPRRTREVPARDIFMRWEEYEIEENRREKLRQEREAEALAKRKKQQQEEAELRLKMATLLGVPESVVSRVTPYIIELDRMALERGLDTLAEKVS